MGMYGKEWRRGRSADAVDAELPEEDKQAAGNAMHYAFGIVTGAAYGAMVEEWPGRRFGSPRVHAMALGSHLIYGLVTELTRRVLTRGLRGRRTW